MPTYDYVCMNCEHEFEAFQSITAGPLTECPKCGGPVKRKIGPGAGLIFKGSGFYITDYKKNGDKKSPPETSDSSKPKSESKLKTDAAREKE